MNYLVLKIYKIHTIISIMYNNIYKIIEINYNLKLKKNKLIKKYLKFSKIKFKNKEIKNILCKLNYKINLYDIKKFINKKITIIGIYKSTDINNIGSCLRSINALGGDALFLFKKKNNINQKLIDISMGSLTPLFIINKFLKNLIKIKKMGIKIICMNENSKLNLFKSKNYLKNNIMFLIGNEKNGIKDNNINNLCDYNVFIPMLGNINSLNISNVVSICLYENIRKNYF